MKNILFLTTILVAIGSQAEVFKLQEKCYNKVSRVQQTLAESFLTGSEKLQISVVAKGAEGSEDGLSLLEGTGFFIVESEDQSTSSFETIFKVLPLGDDCKVVEMKTSGEEI